MKAWSLETLIDPVSKEDFFNPISSRKGYWFGGTGRIISTSF